MCNDGGDRFYAFVAALVGGNSVERGAATRLVQQYLFQRGVVEGVDVSSLYNGLFSSQFGSSLQNVGSGGAGGGVSEEGPRRGTCLHGESIGCATSRVSREAGCGDTNGPHGSFEFAPGAGLSGFERGYLLVDRSVDRTGCSVAGGVGGSERQDFCLGNGSVAAVSGGESGLVLGSSEGDSRSAVEHVQNASGGEGCDGVQGVEVDSERGNRRSLSPGADCRLDFNRSKSTRGIRGETFLGVTIGCGRSDGAGVDPCEPPGGAVEADAEVVEDKTAVKREKRKRKKAARKARKSSMGAETSRCSEPVEVHEKGSEVPEWRRSAGPPGMPRPGSVGTGASPVPLGAVNSVKASFRSGGFFGACGEKIRSELAESRAKRFIAENALKTAEAEDKVRGMQKKGTTQFVRDLTANLQAVAKLRKAAADNKKVSGWVDAIANRSVEELSSDASGIVPPLSDFVGEESAAVPNAESSPSGGTIDYKRKAEYLEERAKLEEHFDYIGAYENWQYEEAFDRLKQRYIDVAGTPTERIDVDIQDRLFELMDNDPNPEKFEYVLDKLNTMRNKMYIC